MTSHDLVEPMNVFGRNINAHLLAIAEQRVQNLHLELAICEPEDQRRRVRVETRLREAEDSLRFTREMIELEQPR